MRWWSFILYGYQAVFIFVIDAFRFREYTLLLKRYLLASNSKHLLVIVQKAPPPTSLHRTLCSFVCVGGCLCLRGKFKSRLSTIRCGEFRPISRQMRLRSKMCTGVPCTLDPRDLYPCTDFYLSLFFPFFFVNALQGIARHCNFLMLLAVL